MKKIYIIFVQIIIILSVYSQNKVYRYDIKVVNKVVYARVIYKGKLVDKLTKEDFILYENGKRKNIESIDIIYKKLGEEKIGFEVNGKKQYKPRYFVLTFDIIDFGDYIINGLDYLFNNVLRKNDKLMFMSGHYFFKENNLKNKERIKEKIIKILKRESILSKIELNGVFSQIRSIKHAVDEYIASQRGRNPDYFDPREINNIKEKIVMFLRWYKKRYLIPDISKFYYFAQYLNDLKMKKWVLNFYQIKKIPIPNKIIDFWNKEGSRWAFDPLLSELNIPQDFPSEEMKKLFYKVNTTFYTFLLTKDRDTLDKDYTFKSIYTDLEKTIKDISFSTGGDVILSNDIKESFREMENKKDIIYLINYKPESKNPKIKIIMKNKNYKVKYDSDQFSDYIKDYMEKKRKENPEIEIENFSFKNNELCFRINNYKMKEIKGGKIGKVSVSIKIDDSEGKTLFNQKKILFLKDQSARLKIKFNNIKKGIHYLYLDVYDFLTKKLKTVFEVMEIK